MRSAWMRMKLANANSSTNLPPLLIKYELGTSSYTIWMTDLTLTWIESLDRKQIIQRSFDVDTSIDPSEGPNQFRLFLQSISNAFKEQDGTHLTLVQGSGDQKLLLRACTPLPGSLKPLEWFAELAIAPQSTLTAELIVPMLGDHVDTHFKQASLLEQLKEKDLIITKMIDKLQSDGVDLGRVFPGIASAKIGRQTSRNTLGKSVKGLGEFDEQQWSKRYSKNVAALNAYPDLVYNAFKIRHAEDPELIEVPNYNAWWERLDQKHSHQNAALEGIGNSKAEDIHVESEYQRQSTPMELKPASSLEKGVKMMQQKNTRQHYDDSDATTDSSEHSSYPISPALRSRSISPVDSKLVSNRQDLSSSRCNIGNIDYVTSEDVSIQNAGDSKQRVAPVGFAGDTLDEREDIRADSRSVEAGVPEEDPVKSKAKAKLGKIGGKGKASKEKENGSQANPNPHTPSRVFEIQNNQSADGTTEASANSKAETARIGRVAIKAQDSATRESSQERANKKREQLKRELDAKSAAGSKKKRRF